MLKVVLLVVCALVAIGIVLYFFFWNRILGAIISALLKLTLWTQDSTAVWVDIGSGHVSLIAGRIILRDVRYHSSNQAFRIVKFQLNWRWWIRDIAEEEDLADAYSDSIDSSSGGKHSPRCRIHITMEGFEWFMYNRTAAFENILANLLASNPVLMSARTKSRESNSYSVNNSLIVRGEMRSRASLYSAGRRMLSAIQLPSFVDRLSFRIRRQLPDLNPRNLLPLSFEVVKGAITMGNHTTESLLLGQFTRAYGTFGIVQSRSALDDHKQMLRISFKDAAISCVENPDYWGSNQDIGKSVNECFVHLDPPISLRTVPLTYANFKKLWARCRKHFLFFRPRGQRYAKDQKRKAKGKEPREETSHIGADFSKLEYAIDRKLLEAPLLELVYYADVAGRIPQKPVAIRGHVKHTMGIEFMDIGNGDLPPEWGVEVVVHNGSIHYGPWADRQRVQLQRVFFPQTFQTNEPTPSLAPGDQRTCTCLKLIFEFRGVTTVLIPFREASKNWQWDGLVDIPRLRRQREAASIQVRLGDKSTVKYFVPMVATTKGYTAEFDVFMDDVSVTSSLNDIRLLGANSCTVSSLLPSPLQWNIERSWDFDITLDRPVLYVIRDHINMLTDLGKDWSSGPPHDFNAFVPITYSLKLILNDFELNLYANDHNIIDRPLDKGDNVLFTLKGEVLKDITFIPSNRFRPLFNEVTFSVVSPDVALSLSLPRWNTHALAAYSVTCLRHIGQAGLLELNGSYTYHAEVRNDCVDRLKLNIEMPSTSMKLLGWVIRHIMVLRENYFGGFTQYSTTREYLSKRESGIAVGDPLDLKYRPGKNNVFHFDLSLVIRDGTAVFPAGNVGFERAHTGHSDDDADVGSCAVLLIPELQLLLRLHDFAMEMSLNTDPITLGTVDFCPDRLLFSHKLLLPEQLLSISGLQITANRLFGPQPHTTTYVCIWKIALGNVKGCISTSEAQIAAAAEKTFAHSFTDPFNAPSSDYAIPGFPDATFLDVSVDYLDVSWKNEPATIRLSLGEGLRFAYNNIAEARHRKLTSMMIPVIDVQMLLSPGTTKYWLEAGRIRTGISFEQYSAPIGWREDAKRQKAFLMTQDSETHRFSLLYGTIRGRGSSKWSSGLYLQSIHTPKVSSSQNNSRKRSTASLSRDVRQRSPHVPVLSESDDELHISEVERDKRLVSSRPSRTSVFVRKEDGYDSSPLDESDEIDDHSSEDSWSDYFEFGGDGQTDARLPYLAFCRKFQLHRGQSVSDMEIGPLTAKKTPDIQSYLFSEGVSTNNTIKSSSVELHRNRSNLGEADTEGKKYYMVDIKDTRVFVTALCLSTFKEILEQPDFDDLSPELRLDQIMLKQIARPAGPTSMVYDARLRSLDFCFVHEAPDLLKVRPGGEYLTDDVHAFVVTKTSVQTVRLLVGGPSSESSTPTGASLAYGSISVGKVAGSMGSLYTSSIRTPHDSLTPSAAVEFSVSDLTVAIAKSQYQVFYDTSELTLLRSAPEVAIAAAGSLQSPVKELLMTQRNRALTARRRKKQLILGILSQDTPMLSKDLLSSVQPTFFVQSGRPQRLRGDTSWKLLFHLRLSLSGLTNEKYVALKQELHAVPEVTDMDQLLQSRPVPRALEDGSSVLNVEIVESLFRENTEKLLDPAQRHDSKPPKSAIFQANSLSLTVDNGDSSNTSLIIREIDLRADLLTRRMIFEAVSLSPYSSTIRSYQPTSEYVDYGSVTALLALDVESMQVTIFPSFIGFLQNSIHVWRVLRPSSEATIKQEGKPASRGSSSIVNFLGNRVAACDMRLVLNHMLVEAAAENIVFEITSRRYQGCCVAHVTKPMEGASLDLSVSHTNGFHDFAVKARTRSIEERDMETLAGITVIGGVSCLLFQNHTPHGSNLRGTINATSLDLSVPKSAIRLYKLMEQWREDYLLGIESMLRSLFAEIKQTPDRQAKQSTPKKRLSMHVNASLSAASIILQVMHGTWLGWTAYGVIGYAMDRSDTKGLARTCGLQIASQVIRITSTSADPPSTRISKIALDLPSISASGSFNVERSAFLISVGFLDVTIKPSHWDSILSVQQKFGQDFNDLLLILGDQRDKFRRSGGRKSSKAKTTQPLFVTAKFAGFRVGMEGHSFTQFLECVDIDAMIINKGSSHWHVNLTDLALYLSPRTLAKHKLAELDRGQLPALISVDLRVVNQTSVQDGQRKLAVAVTKAHAILQAHLMGDIGDFFDHLQVELMLRKEQRAAELSGFKEKASKVMKAFNLNPKKSVIARHERFLDNASITVSMANFGAVFPLDLERRHVPKNGFDKRITTKALLLSIKSVKFETQRGESGEAFMEGFCFQFVSRFDPSNPDDFSARRHHTLNQMLYPEMTARMRTETASSSRRTLASASISGFILDLDPSITTYFFALVDAYRQGKQRVEQLAITMPRSVAESGTAAIQKTSSKTGKGNALTSSIEASLEFMSGTVRMHCTSKDSSAFSSISPDWSANTYQILDSDAEIFRLPALSVSVEYRADVQQLGASAKRSSRSPVVLLRSTIHSSRNALRPLLLSFVSGIVRNVEERMKQNSHMVTRSPSSIRYSISNLTSEERDANLSPILDKSGSPSLQIFISLRIDKSRLEFTCRPDVNVIAGVNWESGGFVLNMGPGAKGVSISASIEGLTIGLKHGFLSEDSAHIDARNLLFSINFSKSSLSSGQFINSISMVVDTEFSGGLRFSRFQDILCFKAVWLDHIPILKGDTAEDSVSPSRLSAVSSLEPAPKQGFDTSIVVRVRHIALEADLGQSISTVTFNLERALLQMRLTSEDSKVATSFARVDMQARGNLSGHLRMPDFVFRTVRRRQRALEKQPLSRMLELSLTSGTLDIQLQSDWLWLLQYRAEPLEARIYDDWTVDSASTEVKKRQLHLYSSVSGSKVVAMMTIMAIPKLLMYAGKFRTSLDTQREGASRESSAFRSTRLPKPDNALSEVANAMFRSARSKLKETEALSYVINQHMKLQLSELVFVVLPRSQGDTELARFIGRNVMAQLDRTVQQVDLPAHRDLQLSLSYMSISQLIKQGFDPRLPGQEFDVLTATGRNFPGTRNVIFSLPAMDMRMISDEGTEGGTRILPYDFESKFARREGRRGEDIHISFNIRLYSWLTILRKTFTRELKRAQEFADGENAAVSPPTTNAPKLASPDTSASPFTYDSEGALSPPASPRGSPPPSRRPSRSSSPIRSRSAESVIIGSPGKGKSAQYPVSLASPKIGPSDSRNAPEQGTGSGDMQTPPTSAASASKPVTQDSHVKKSQEIVYIPRSRNIERLTVKQLGEATPDVMHPFFTKKAGFNLEESLPQYVHEYATLPIEEIMKGLVKLYSKQLD